MDMSSPHNEKIYCELDPSKELEIYARGWGKTDLFVVFLGQEIAQVRDTNPFSHAEARGIIKGILLSKQLPALRAKLKAEADAKDRKEFARLSKKFGKTK